MEGKKRYVAIILFLLICLMLFTFATTGEEELETGNGNGSDIQEVTNKGDSDKDKETETEQENSNESNSGSTGSSNNGNSNAGDDEDLEGTGNTDNSAWDKALAAVEELEKVLTDDQLNTARELVEEITNSDQYKELIERVEDAEDAIDATALVEALEKMVEEATKRDDIEDASDFRDEEVIDAINEIDGEYLEDVKEKLLERIEELNKILDDNTAPTVEGIEDGTNTNKDVELTITDANKVTTTVTKDGETYDEVEKFTEEGTYEVTVVDSAFNETKLTFTIDKTKPKFEGLKSREEHIDNYEIDVTDATDVTITIQKDHGKHEEVEEGYEITEEGTYQIIATDAAGNKASTWVIVDKTNPTITNEPASDFVNSCTTITVFDRYLTNVTINEEKYARKDFEKNTKNENFKLVKEYCEEGTYVITAKDKSGKEVTKSIEIDKTAIAVQSANMYTNGNKYEVDKDVYYYATKGQKITAYVRLKEQSATLPVITLTIDGKEYVLENVKESFHNKNDEANGIYKYEGTFTIPEDMEVKNSEVSYKVTNITDKAGNETTVSKVTNKNIIVVDTINPVVDKLALVGGKCYWYGKEYKQYATNGTIVYVNARFKEELATTPVVTLNDTITLTQATKKEVKGIWIYSYSYRLTENDGIADGVLQVKVTNAKDKAGNSAELTNADATMESQSEIIVDRKAPTYKFYKVGSSLDKDEIQPTIIDGKLYFNQNVRVRFVEDGSHFTQYIHDDFVNNENKTSIKTWSRETKNDGVHTMKVTDASGNVTEVTFVVDTTAPTYKFYKEGSSLDKDEIQPTIIDGKLYFNQNVRVRFVEETSFFTQYIHNDFVNNENKTTIQTWSREAKNDGEHTMKVTDALGHVTEVTFTVDTTAPTYKFYKEGSSLDKDEIQPTIIDGKMYFDQNVRVRFVEETTYFTQYIHNDFVNNENKTTIQTWTREAKNDGEHTMKVTDALGHVTEVTFTVDKTAPTYKFYKEGSSLDKDEIQPIMVNGKLYFNQNVRVRFVEKTTYFTQYIHNDFVNNEDKTTIQTWTREAKANGEHTMKVTDALGHVTEVTFTIDKIAPELTVKKESVGTDPYYSSISFKLYDNNKVDYLMINGKKFDVGNAQWSDANYDAIKGYLVEGENTATLYDEAGNSTTYKFTMDWTAPAVTEFTQKYDAEAKGVKVTLTFSESMKSVDEGWTKVEDKENTYSKVFTTTGEQTITFKDLAGNEGTYTFTVDATPNRVTQTFYRGDKNIDKTYYVKNGDKIQFNIGFSEKLGEDAVITIGGKKVELTYEKYFEATKSHMYYGYLEIAEDETEMKEGELEIVISNITDEVGNPGFYYQTNGKKVLESYSNVVTTNGKKVVYDRTSNRVTQTFFRGENEIDKVYYLTNGSKIQFNIGFREKLGSDAIVTIGGKQVELTYEKFVKDTNSHMYYGYLEITAEDQLPEGILEIKISNVTDFVGNTGFYYQTNGKKVLEEITQDKTTNGKQIFYDVTGPEVTPSYTETTTEQDEEFTNFPTFEVKDNSTQTVKEELISNSIDTTTLGTYELTYRFTDVVGNYTDVTVKVRVVDTKAPELTGLVDGAYYNTIDTHAIPSATDKNGAIVMVKTTIGDATIESIYKNNKEITQVGTYQVYAIDKFGNKSEEITVHIDPYAPKVLVLDRVENVSGAYLPIKPVILEHNLDTIEVTLDGNKIDFKEGDQLTKDGKYVMTVTDKAGNSTTVEFTMDSVAPTMLVSPTSLGVVDSLDLNDTNNITGLIISEEANFQLMKVEKYITIADKNIPVYKYTKLTEDRIIDEEGEYIIIAYDKAYNVTAYKFTVDRTAPVINAEEGKFYSSLTLDVKDGNLGTITVKEDGSFIGIPVENGYVIDEDGTYTITAKDTIANNILFDKEVREAHTTTVTIHIDTKAPEANVVENGVYKQIKIEVTDTNLDAESITVNGEAYNNETITEEGNYTLKAKDLAGNELVVKFEVDSEPITIDGVNAEYNNTAVEIEVIARDENVKVELNGETVEKTFTATKEGLNRVVTTDKWGNKEELEFIIDTTNPTISNPAALPDANTTVGAVKNTSINVVGKVSDTNPTETEVLPAVTHSVKGNLGKLSSIETTKEYVGTYTLTYNTVDKAGNTLIEPLVITVEVIIDDYVLSFNDIKTEYTYGDTIPALTFEDLTMISDDEKITLTAEDITFDVQTDKMINAGKYTVTATANETKFGKNRVAKVTFTVNPKEVTVTFEKNDDRLSSIDEYEFNGERNPFKTSITGLLEKDIDSVTATVTYNTTTFGVGSYTATATLNSDNYTIANATHNFTINQAQATVTLPLTVDDEVVVTNGEGFDIASYATIIVSEELIAKGTQDIETKDYTSSECKLTWSGLQCPTIQKTYVVAIKYQTIQAISNDYMDVPNTEGKIVGDDYIKKAAQVAKLVNVTIVEDVYEQVKTSMPTTGTSSVYITETPTIEEIKA